MHGVVSHLSPFQSSMFIQTFSHSYMLVSFTNAWTLYLRTEKLPQRLAHTCQTPWAISGLASPPLSHIRPIFPRHSSLLVSQRTRHHLPWLCKKNLELLIPIHLEQ